MSTVMWLFLYKRMPCASLGSQAADPRSDRDLDWTLTLLYLQRSSPDSDPADVVSCSGRVQLVQKSSSQQFTLSDSILHPYRGNPVQPQSSCLRFQEWRPAPALGPPTLWPRPHAISTASPPVPRAPSHAPDVITSSSPGPDALIPFLRVSETSRSAHGPLGCFRLHIGSFRPSSEPSASAQGFSDVFVNARRCQPISVLSVASRTRSVVPESTRL